MTFHVWKVLGEDSSAMNEAKERKEGRELFKVSRILFMAITTHCQDIVENICFVFHYSHFLVSFTLFSSNKTKINCSSNSSCA